MEKVNWFDATKDFPEFDKKVLGFYIIPATDGKGKKTGEVYEYYEIIHLESITERANQKSGHWVDSEYNSVNPLYWCYLPNSPLN